MSDFFIIKADDLHLNRIKGGWQYFLALLKENSAQADLGVIGKSVVADFPCKELILRNELFLHGYFHEMMEYKDSSLSRQSDLIARTRNKIQQELGILVDIFGAPGNNISEETLTALQKNRIKVWFFGKDDSRGGIVNLKNKLRFEFSDQKPDRFRQQRVYGSALVRKYFNGIRKIEREWLNMRIPDNCGFDELAERYHQLKNNNLVIGQIHPHQWSRKDLSGFVKFIQFIQNKEKRIILTAGKYVSMQYTSKIN